MDISQVTTTEYAATLCFILAILHTFSVKFFQNQARKFKEGSVGENLFHFLGEVEIIFGIWAAIFFIAFSFLQNFDLATEYLESRSYTEPFLVFVLMAVCSTRPILFFAKSIISKIAHILPLQKNLAFYLTTLVVGPLLGSLITEPAAMTVTALILLESFYKNKISERLKYATLGLLFVNISIGGTLTSYAAPPVLMVAKKWDWDSIYMLTHFGWKAVLSIFISTALVAFRFKKEFLNLIPFSSEEKKINIPFWIILVHLLFLILIIMSHHHSVLFIQLFLFFLGFVVATNEYQSDLQLKSPLLVSFFLAGLVILGGQQGWWLTQLLQQLGVFTMYLGATLLTAITDNAAITYLGSQVPNLSEASKYALVSGSVVGGGLTVIANAPNPVGYSILNSTFDPEGISAKKLLLSALIPTTITFLIFWIL